MVKKIKVLTAIGNENLNNILKEQDEFEILENDIFYKEGILEFLEKNNDVDILILYENLAGEINIINLINKIKIINNEINIFFILENKNDEVEKILKKENIKNIFYINEINVNDFIEKIKNAKINNNEKLIEEINLLKNIINKKDEELIKYKNNNFENKKLVIFIGEKNVGKTTILNNLKNIYWRENIFEFKEMNMNDYLKIKNETYKIIFVLERKIDKIKFCKKIINELIFKNKISPEKINIIFNKIDNYSINKNISKSILKNINIIGNIKLNKYPDYLINEKNNYKKENKELIKYFFKIIKKINA